MMENSKISLEFLTRFENNFDPSHAEESGFEVKIIGFGEISAIFIFAQDKMNAYKRMPLFNDPQNAEKYAELYHQYCHNLGVAGLNIPPSNTRIIASNRGIFSLYISQPKFDGEQFAHKLLHVLRDDERKTLLDDVFSEIEKVFLYNHREKTKLELSIDGQLSNWVKRDGKLWFIDTSTPLFKIENQEQLDPEPLLKSAPSFLRWILRLFFLDDVMNRYYDQRLVFIDLIANLYKEQLPELIPAAIDIANKHSGDLEKITRKEIDDYYKEDKMIWTLFLAFRRFDRWLTTKMFGKRYEFILPGKIER